LAKVISPSSDAKTAPPIKAAPHRPVRMVPLNHCTETRRRSMTAASVPSTESGGSWPRSMIPASRPYPPPRDVRWLKPPSPQIPSTFDNPCRSTPVPHSPPWKGAPPEHGAPHRMEFGNQEARRPAGIQNVNGAHSSRCFSAVLGKGGDQSPSVPSSDRHRQPPLAFRCTNTYLIVRTSQECGSSTAQDPEI